MPDENVITSDAGGAETPVADDLDFDISVEEPSGTTQETSTTETLTDATKTSQEPPKGQEPPPKTEPGAKQPALVSGRLLHIVKEAPELKEVLSKYPKVQEQIEASFRRDAAYRDIFPTVAEARALREKFPNGVADVQEMESDIAESQAIDNDFYTRDAQGNYPGHTSLINHLWENDKQATIAMFRQFPRDWARLDPESYSDVMGRIVGATLVQTGSWEALLEFRDTLSGNEATKNLVPGLDKILNRLNGFLTEKKVSPEDQRLAEDRRRLDADRATHSKEMQQQFNRSFISESRKLQNEVIGKHRIMQKLATVKSISPEKRVDITEKIRSAIEKFLGNSPSFMRKLIPAYESGNLDESLKIQRAAWSQEWLLNRMIASVLRVETPQLVAGNRSVVQNRIGNAVPPPKAQPNGDNKTKQPFQEGGRWYHGDGRLMTVEESMRHAMSVS